MDAVIRRKLAMAVRVRDFVLANPGTDAGYIAIAKQLTDALVKVDALAIKEQDGMREERGSVQYRRTLRRQIHSELLLHLERVAQRVVRERPDMAGTFRRLAPNTPLNAFITNAHALLASAQAETELLLKHGMSQALLDELATAVKQFDAATESAHASRRDHVGAREQLAQLAGELVELVGLLDAMVRSQFRGNAEVIAAWESASTVVRFHHQPAPEDAPTPEPAPAADVTQKAA